MGDSFAVPLDIFLDEDLHGPDFTVSCRYRFLQYSLAGCWLGGIVWPLLEPLGLEDLSPQGVYACPQSRQCFLVFTAVLVGDVAERHGRRVTGDGNWRRGIALTGNVVLAVTVQQPGDALDDLQLDVLAEMVGATLRCSCSTFTPLSERGTARPWRDTEQLLRCARQDIVWVGGEQAAEQVI